MTDKVNREFLDRLYPAMVKLTGEPAHYDMIPVAGNLYSLGTAIQWRLRILTTDWRRELVIHFWNGEPVESALRRLAILMHTHRHDWHPFYKCKLAL